MKLNSTNYKSLKGKTIKIQANTAGQHSGHAYGPSGTKILVKTISLSRTNTTNPLLSCVRLNGGTYSIYLGEIATDPETIAEIKKEIAQLEEEISVLQAKVAYMTENKLEEFDETEFTVFHVLQEIKNDSSDLAKAKAIARLINGQ